jgi:hypothetical protein
MKRRAMSVAILLVLAAACCRAAMPTGAEVLGALRKARLDAKNVYRVREATISKEDLRVYLEEGTLVFVEPVQGRVIGAIFVGEGEVLLRPPDPVERGSMARFIHTPLLDEKFTSAVFRFTDDTYERLRESLADGSAGARAEDPDLIAKWNPVVGNLQRLSEMRVLTDLLAREPIPFFSGRFSGNSLGTFDVLVDYRQPEQVTAGQANWKDNRRFSDLWCLFAARSVRNHTRAAPAETWRPVRYRIESQVLPTRAMQVKADVDIQPARSGERVLSFELSRSLKVASVQLLKGAAATPVEFSQNELIEENELKDRGNDQVTVILPEPTEAGQSFTLSFRYEGEVISDAGNGVLFVGARGIWYPNRGLQSAQFDLTFRCPRRLTLVATGDRLEDRDDGEWRVSRWRSPVPLRVAGFNLGEYDKSEGKAAAVQIEVYANKNLEPALQRQQRVPAFLLDTITDARVFPTRGRLQPPPPVLLLPPVPPSMQAVAANIASDTAHNLEFFTRYFGPLPYRRLAISPIPGNFGQGWPGLVYLSTLAFFLPYEASAPRVAKTTEIFYRTQMRSHELAHQWWGNVVIPGSYRDEWLIEGLANYSALMYLQTRRSGEQEVRLILERAKQDLLQKDNELAAEQAGPPVLGYRLLSSRSPSGVDAIMYKKATWIMHMLRQLMRDPRSGSDAAFFSFLRAVRNECQDKPLTTELFRQIAEKYVVRAANIDHLASLEWFFDQWVYATGIPELRAKTSVETRAGKLQLSGTISLDGVDENFSLPVPIYAQTLRGQSLVGIAMAVGRETSFSFPLAVRPAKVLVDPQATLLAVVK